MNLRKTYFILPNLFTLGSVFCGLFAITVFCDHPTIDGLYQAAIAICFALFFDLTDGRVARLTRTQSSLGRELDSLADVISFGVAPSLLVYRWGLSRFEKLGRHLGFAIAFLLRGGGAAARTLQRARDPRGGERTGGAHARQVHRRAARARRGCRCSRRSSSSTTSSRARSSP